MYLMVNGSPDASSVVPFHQEIREFVMTPRDLSQQTASAEAVIVASETMAHDQQHVGRRSLVVPAEDFLVGENAVAFNKEHREALCSIPGFQPSWLHRNTLEDGKKAAFDVQPERIFQAGSVPRFRIGIPLASVSHQP